LGFAIGVAVSFTPLLGFHLLLTVALAWLLRGNVIAGGVGTAVGNPLTFPFIWASSYEVGHLILRGSVADAPQRLHHLLTRESLWDILPLAKPLLVGSAPLGAAAGGLAYILVYNGVAAYQESRRRRLAERRSTPVAAGPMTANGKEA
jgi:uncharacterized protein (DUF2062 family)